MQRIALLIMVFLLLGVVPLGADEVILLNGDRLSGTIKKLNDQVLVIETDLERPASKRTELEIDIAKVRTLSTDAPLEVHFRDGVTLKGRFTASETGRGATIQPEGLPALPIDFGNLVASTPVRWTGSARAGLLLSRGNAETDNFNAGLRVRRRSGFDRFTLGAEYLFGRQRNPDTRDRKTTQDEWFVGLKYDYFFTEKVYGYGAVRVERDHIADLDLRLIAGAGAGYQWIESEDVSVAFEAGLAWLYENFETGDSSDEITLRAAYFIDKLMSWYIDVEFFHDLEIFPAFSDPSDFFLTTQFGARTKLSKSIFVEAKLVIDHDSTPAPGADKTDYTWLFGAGVTF